MHLIYSYVADFKEMQISLLETSFNKFYELFEYLYV